MSATQASTSQDTSGASGGDGDEPKLDLGKKKESTGTLGTFVGVFTPTLLTILGVIMYLRFGWMVGHVGLLASLVIVVLGNAITIVTAWSFSAIATNTRVGIGGAYFMISRSLGIEFGGAIGLPLFLSQTFSVTLYAFGLAESLRIVWPDIPVNFAAFLIVGLVGAISFRGADWALKAQLPIMGLVGLSVIAMGIGAMSNANPPELSFPENPEVGFWAVFAIFFPAVTGVMAGLGLSGDLKDPQTAIPRGSLGAGFAGFIAYLIIPVLLALGATPEVLRENPMVWAEIAPLGALLILPGLWGAILSSAIGSMLGAPRTLQALAMDGVAPRFLAKSVGPQKDPLLGLGVSLAIAVAAVFLGGLDAVAPVVTMFFLTVYGMVNLVAALETLSGDASWRPKIRVPWLASLAAALACFAVMFLISPITGLIAIAVEIVLWLWLQRRERKADWGDMRRDVYEALIRWALVRLARRPMTARNWRPHIIVFAENIEKRLDLVRYGSWFSQDRGVVTVCQLVTGDLLKDEFDPRAESQAMADKIREEGIVAFSEVSVVNNIVDGMVGVSQANGMAGLTSNCALLGLPKETEKLTDMLRVSRYLEKLNKSVLIGRTQRWWHPKEGRRPEIHVWWGGLQRNGDLMLLLAHLLTRNPSWRGAQVTVLSIASNEVTQAETERMLGELLPAIRIDAHTRVIVKPQDTTVREIIQTESRGADLVFLGLAKLGEGEEEGYAKRMLEMVEGLPSVFFVKNSSLFVGELVGTKDDA